MSSDPSTRSASRSFSDDYDKVEPTIRDALIGAGIGLLLIYGGTRISNWILSWVVIGVGVIFVAVMSGFVISVVWTKASPRVRRITSSARGHVRTDPQLGTLVRNVEAEAWQGEFKVGDRTVEILIDGKEEPDPALVARARELLADFATFERRLNDYLAETAQDWASETPELAADIAALRLASVKLRSRKSMLVDFAGPDEDVYWSCEYEDGNFSGLDYDS